MRRLQILFFIIGLIYFVDKGSYLSKASHSGHSSISHELILLADTGEYESEESESSVYLLSLTETPISPKLKIKTEHQQYPLSVCEIEVLIPPPRG